MESNRGPSVNSLTPYRWAKPVHKRQTRAGSFFSTFTDPWPNIKCRNSLGFLLMRNGAQPDIFLLLPVQSPVTFPFRSAATDSCNALYGSPRPESAAPDPEATE